MRSAATTLLQNLQGAAEALRKGGDLPKESLAESIVTLRGSFGAIWSTLEQHASIVGIQVEARGEDLSLSSLEALWEQIGALYAEVQRRRSAALALAARVAGLRATNDVAAALLWAPRAEAEELHAELSGEAPVDSDRLDSLTSDSHSFAALLALIDNADDLDDADWERSRSTVANAFGSDLAIAAVRGRIIAPSPGDAEQTLSPISRPSVASDADSEPAPRPVEPAPRPVESAPELIDVPPGVAEPSSSPGPPAPVESDAVSELPPPESSRRPS